MTLTRTAHDGRPAWAWQDPSGRRWTFYRAGSCWRYIRQDHDVSSVAFATLGEAQRDLAAFFPQEATDADE